MSVINNSSQGQGSAMSYAATASINQGLSSSSSVSGGINYTDAGSSDKKNVSELSRFINPLKKKKFKKY